jgi:hypothetical protein
MSVMGIYRQQPCSYTANEPHRYFRKASAANHVRYSELVTARRSP